MSITYNLQTFGCKVNTYDSGLLQSRLEKAGFLNRALPQVYILNTCAVTAEATQSAIKTARKLKREDPSKVIVVTGCAAQVDTQKFKFTNGPDLIIANSHKGQIEELIYKYIAGQLKERVFHSNIFKKEDLETGGGLEEDHTRVFLKIQDGCNSFCSFCVIPFARGKSRSIPINHLVNRIEEFQWNGANEVVLTGVHIGDYEDQTREKNKLEDLIEAILLKTKMPRLRLTSLEPVELSDRLLEFYKDPRMCPHFHMSIQSACTQTLKDMRRKYTAEDVELALIKISKLVPNAFVGMDVIVGFDGESDENFQETRNRLEKLPWTRIHVFPYSERPGTRATKNTQPVPIKTRKKRSLILRELSTDRYSMMALKQVGSIKKTLVLKYNRGLTRDYWPVQLEDACSLEGLEKDVKIIGYDHSLKSNMQGFLKAIHLDARG